MKIDGFSDRLRLFFRLQIVQQHKQKITVQRCQFAYFLPLIEHLRLAKKVAYQLPAELASRRTTCLQMDNVRLYEIISFVDQTNKKN